VLRELPSPGKSGSVFFVSYDERYMIKTMRKVRPDLQETTASSSTRMNLAVDRSSRDSKFPLVIPSSLEYTQQQVGRRLGSYAQAK